MNSADIYGYISALEKENAEQETELHNTRHALRVARDTIQQKQGRIEEFEARGALGDDVRRFLAGIEWAMKDYESAVNRKGSTAAGELKELVSLYRKLWPGEKEGAA